MLFFLLLIFFFFRPDTNLDYSSYLLDRNQEIIQVRPNQQEQYRLKITLNECPKSFLEKLIAIEDKRFYSHLGVDPLALGRAFYQMIWSQRIVSGGSTLTMQVAKLLEPKPRSFFNKLKECFRALQLEFFHSKQEILEFYLNLAPYGGNLQGIRAAALSYFQKEPRFLTLSEEALLIALPQSPTKLRPYKYPEKAKTARNKILNQLQEKFPTLKIDLKASLNEPLPKERYFFKNLALHVHAETSTLDGNLQERLEKFLREQTLPPYHTISLLVVDNKTCEILTYIGSLNYFDESRQGYVDILRSIRSPGSTLKPFIYALAFDERIIDPNSLIDDTYTNFGGYKPKNFRDVFHGEVTIREALQHSFNIPAVMLLEKMGCNAFTHRLRALPIFLKSPKGLTESLPIALGGIGISHLDLASLYVAIANEGKFSPLSLKPNRKTKISILCSPHSAEAVTEILESAPLPQDFAQAKFPVAFKTGTSYGYRDALCVGYTKNHTVLVWIGRADGSPMNNVIGRNDAAPLMLKVFYDFLPKPEERPFLKQIQFTHLPKNLQKVEGVKEKSLNITYPKDGSHYMKTDHILKLQTNSQKPIHWYVNDTLLSSNEWHLEAPGFYRIRVSNNQGASDEITIRIVD